MPMWPIDETDGFRHALAEINASGFDWTDLLAANRWYLERGPLTVGSATQDNAVRILILDGPRGAPGLKVFYVVEDDRVTLLSARIADPPQL